MSMVSAFDSRLLLQEGDEVEVTFRGTAVLSDIYPGEFKIRREGGGTVGSQLLKHATSVKILKRAPREFEHSMMYFDPETYVYWVRGDGYFKSFNGTVTRNDSDQWNDFRARLLKVTPPSKVDGT